MTGDGTQSAGLGQPFNCVERTAVATLGDLGPYLIAANDPPWSTLAPDVPVPTTVVLARNMELKKLERDVEATADDGATVVVGLGGGTALDTAKFLAWKRGLPLVLIPTITSVDAGFTDAIGIRSDGRVRYVGTIEPEEVVLDIALIRSAPPRLNRAGCFSCAMVFSGFGTSAKAKGTYSPFFPATMVFISTAGTRRAKLLKFSICALPLCALPMGTMLLSIIDRMSVSLVAITMGKYC